MDIFKKKFTVAFTFEEDENEMFFSEKGSDVFDELNYEIVTNKNTSISKELFKKEDNNIITSRFYSSTLYFSVQFRLGVIM